MIDRTSAFKLKHTANLNLRRFNIVQSCANLLKIHIYGAPNVGKTSMALLYARNFNNPFYIDFNDMRNASEYIKNTIFKLSMEKKIDLLILDNIPLDWNLFPNNIHIITIGESVISTAGFTNKHITALNFEEFISFDKSNQHISQLLDSFIKYGNLPMMFSLKSAEKLEWKQKMLWLIFQKNIAIFSYICALQGKSITINQIYTSLKKHIKTSKDSLYRLLSDWQARNMLYFVSHINAKNAPKKLFFWDFSIPNAISYERNFIASFTNMLFLELKSSNKDIFYSEKIHLICDNIGYIIAPFHTIDGIRELLINIDTLGLDIVVITLEIEGELKQNGKTIMIKNFIHFALNE